MTDADRIKELEARVKELEEALAKARDPDLFWADPVGVGFDEITDAIDEALYDAAPGRHVVELETARRCDTFWVVVDNTPRSDHHVLIQGRFETEAQARAAIAKYEESPK